MALLAPGALSAQIVRFAAEDPAKIVGAEACGECHLSEHGVWKETEHATGFKTLHRKQAAETIAGKLGYRLIKRDSLCLRCHYTAEVQNEQLRAVSGVSCESCHGAARDWLDVHNDYGGKEFDHTTEAPEHRRMRIERSRAAGMRRPSDLYGTASSCYGCHLVPEEELVNVGGHSVGSSDFELVAWSGGGMRHNFLQSFLTGDGTVNAERPPEHERLMYVVGRSLELEHSLRGVAAASAPGNYANAMGRRVTNAVRKLRRIGSLTGLPEVAAMLDAVRGARVVPDNEAELLAAADSVGAAARGILEGHDGTRLAALDPLVRGEDVEVPGDESVRVAAGGGSPGTGEPGSSPPPGGVGQAGTAKASASGQTSQGAVDPGVPAVGALKKRVRPPFAHATLGQGTCSECHSAENGWWYGNAHSRSADPFFDRRPENVEIARLYGVPPAEMARGEHVCMDCHGTIVTGRERREVNDGVSCESCHGAAGQFLEPHKEGEKSQGLQRPGYVRALKLGMLELKDVGVRARICTGCHYVTEPRLLSAGHPSGRGFDYVRGMSEIRHWDEPPVSATRLHGAFEAVLASRGPVPDVPRARLAGGPSDTEPGLTREARTSRTRGERRGVDAAGFAASRRPRPAPAGAWTEPGEAGAVEVPPFPEIDPSATVEELLLLLKDRLELLYRTVRGEPGGGP